MPAAFNTYPSVDDATDAAVAVCAAAPAHPEGALAFLICASDGAGGLLFAPFFFIRYIDGPRATALAEWVLARGHRVHMGGESHGPEDVSAEEWLDRAVHRDMRICYGVALWATEDQAMLADRAIRLRGDTANGGWFHGQPLGRDPGFDQVRDGVKLYACTYG